MAPASRLPCRVNGDGATPMLLLDQAKAAVLRLLRGEELDALSRELGVTAATLSL